MVQVRKARKASQLPLSQPDRTGPSEKTLLELAQERQLFDQADIRQRVLNKKHSTQRNAQEEEGGSDEVELPSFAEHVLDVVLWSSCLTMLHFTLDVLVFQQYAVEFSWHKITTRALIAFLGKTL